MSHESRPPPSQPQHDLLEQLRATTALLEQIAGNVSVVDALPPAERERLFQAVARSTTRTTSSAASSAGPLHANAVPRTPARARRCCTRPASARCAASRCSRRPRSSRRSASGARRPQAGRRDGRPAGPRLEPQHCYVCKEKYQLIHHFYDQLCPACAELNFRKRTETADLRGRVALLTGGRVKIGYQAGLKLLRAGAQLIVTTRFPRDSAARYAAGAGLRRVGPSAGDLRPGPAPHAQRRGLLPASCWPRATASTSSSTTPARPCAARRSSTRT